MCKNDVSFFQAAFQESRDALHTSKAAFQKNRDALHTSKAAFQESRGALHTSKAASWSQFSTAEHDPQPSKRGGKYHYSCKKRGRKRSITEKILKYFNLGIASFKIILYICKKLLIIT